MQRPKKRSAKPQSVQIEPSEAASGSGSDSDSDSGPEELFRRAPTDAAQRIQRRMQQAAEGGDGSDDDAMTDSEASSEDNDDSAASSGSSSSDEEVRAGQDGRRIPTCKQRLSCLPSIPIIQLQG